MRVLWPIVCVLAVAACSSRPAPDPDSGEPVAPPERGISLAPYSGVFAEHPRLRRALARLPEALAAAEREVEVRLGLTLDPDRPRRVMLLDREDDLDVTSRVVGGRRVQEVPIAAGPIAQGRRRVEAAAAEALARAALADPRAEGIPGWFRTGAPLWVGGGWERALYGRLLGGPAEDGGLGDRIAPIRLEGDGNDPVSAGLFVRFVAVEFGAERVADLGRAFASGGGTEESLRAALRTDPASVPTAFDGFRLRAAASILENPYVRELFAARNLSPAERTLRLVGLEGQVEDPWIAAAVLEERARAEYETGDFESALGTLAGIERDHAAHALALDRDRFLYAMCFLRRGDQEAGALRLRGFVEEFPGSPLITEARFRLGEVLLETGRAEDAMVEFRAVASAAAPDAMRSRAAVALGAWLAARHRYAAAQNWLSLATGSEEARRLRAEIRERVRQGLPPAGVSLVRESVEDLRSSDPARVDAGERVLVEVGELAAPTLLVTLAGDPEEWPAGLAACALRLARDWRTPAGDRVFLRLLAVPGAEVAPEALEELVTRGRSPDSLFSATPEGSAVREHWEARFGVGRLPEDLVAELDSEDWEQRVRGADRLSRRTGAYAARLLAEMSSDESPRVRSAVAGFLARRPEKAIGEALFALAADPSALVRSRAYAASGVRGDWGLVRHGMEDDPDPGVRAACARIYLESGVEGAPAAVVGLLADPEAEVRAAVEPILRSSRASGIDRALADALPGAEAAGQAMRLVRIVADRAGTDFGYDPGGGESERRRVADAFRKRIEAGAGN